MLEDPSESTGLEGDITIRLHWQLNFAFVAVGKEAMA